MLLAKCIARISNAPEPRSVQKATSCQFCCLAGACIPCRVRFIRSAPPRLSETPSSILRSRLPLAILARTSPCSMTPLWSATGSKSGFMSIGVSRRSWIEQHKFVNSGTDIEFGNAVAVHGDWMAIAARERIAAQTTRWACRSVSPTPAWCICTSATSAANGSPSGFGIRHPGVWRLLRECRGDDEQPAGGDATVHAHRTEQRHCPHLRADPAGYRFARPASGRRTRPTRMNSDSPWHCQKRATVSWSARVGNPAARRASTARRFTTAEPPARPTSSAAR